VANFVFDVQRNNMLGTGTRVDLDTDTIRAMFVDHADDTPLVTDATLSDIASAGQVPARASCPALSSPTIGTVGVGIFDAADTVFSSLTGDQSESLIVFKDGGTDASSPLVHRYDTATGLPLTPNGGNVTVVWAAGGILSV
jgi:hypothetical protein